MRLKNFLLVSCIVAFGTPLTVSAQDAAPPTKTSVKAADASKFVGVFRGRSNEGNYVTTLILNSTDGINFTGYVINLDDQDSTCFHLESVLKNNTLSFGYFREGLFRDVDAFCQITAQGDELKYEDSEAKYRNCLLTKQSDELFSEVPFDEASKQLAKNFKGHNIIKLFDTVEKLPRGEFETADAYYARIAAKMGMKGKWDSNSLFTAYLNIDPDSAAIKYDIDAKTMRISLSWANGIPWGSTLEGGKAIDYKLAFKNLRVDKANLSLSDFGPEDAQLIKPNLDILVVFQLAAPAINGRSLQVNVKKFVWLNSKTGDIVAEFGVT